MRRYEPEAKALFLRVALKHCKRAQQEPGLPTLNKWRKRLEKLKPRAEDTHRKATQTARQAKTLVRPNTTLNLPTPRSITQDIQGLRNIARAGRVMGSPDSPVFGLLEGILSGAETAAQPPVTRRPVRTFEDIQKQYTEFLGPQWAQNFREYQARKKKQRAVMDRISRQRAAERARSQIIREIPLVQGLNLRGMMRSPNPAVRSFAHTLLPQLAPDTSGAFSRTRNPRNWVEI